MRTFNIKCDSCGKEVDTLIPIKVLDFILGREVMRTKYYCPRCFIIKLGIEPRIDYYRPSGETNQQSR